MILECLAIAKPTAIIAVPTLFNRVSKTFDLYFAFVQ